MSAFAPQTTRGRAVAGPLSFQPHRVVPSQATGAIRSPLFSKKDLAGTNNKRPVGVTQRTRALVQSCFRAIRGQLRRRIVLAYAATLFSLGVLGGGALPAHASSTAAAATSSPIERVLQKTSPSIDQMIDRYVKEHMFDDDTYDPVESVYREAYDDATRGSYPRALREVTGLSLTGSQEAAASTSNEGGNALLKKLNIGGLLTSTLGALQSKAGLSESAAIMVLAGVFVVAGPCAFLFSGMIIGGMSKRNMNKVMKKRYGDTYTVDATPKAEEDVEAPDDDDEDDAEEDDDDDDEGDDE